MTTDHDELLAPDDIERLEHSRTCMDCTGSTVADKLIKALRAVVELVKPYLEHDIKNVAKVDGVYDKEQAEAWEKVHGHDIRLNCYPEFGCQLLIDPEDLFLAIEKELG